MKLTLHVWRQGGPEQSGSFQKFAKSMPHFIHLFVQSIQQSKAFQRRNVRKIRGVWNKSLEEIFPLVL